MIYSTQKRVEALLTTIDRLGIVKIKHLMAIHDLKSYRNACRVVTQLKPYIHETFYDREKIIYLNQKGRELIASEKEESKRGNIEHTLLRNDVFIHLGCPYDWQNEHPLEATIKPKNSEIFALGSVTLTQKKKVIADAVFTRNGYLYIVEIDNERKMIDNKAKVQNYRDILPAYKNAVLYFFTKTESRERKLSEMMKGMKGEVKTFAEIR